MASSYFSCFAKVWISPSFRRPVSLSRDDKTHRALEVARAPGPRVRRPGKCSPAPSGSHPAGRHPLRREGAAQPLRLPRRNSSRKSCSGISSRRPSFSTRLSSLSARLTSVGIAGRRKSGTRIARRASCTTLAVAAVDQHVRDLLFNGFAARDGEQMRLAFLLGDARQDRSVVRRVDCVRTGPATAISSSWASRRMTSCGRLFDRRKPLGELGARLGFHPRDQMREHIVEHADLRRC